MQIITKKASSSMVKVKSSTYSMVKTMTIDDLLVKFKSLERIDHNSRG